MIVVWRVTEACNLACPFCAHDRRLTRSRRHADPVAIRRFGGVLADYQQATGDRVLVSWLGGEPLLWPPLSALTEHFAGPLGLRVSTTTNGTTLGDPAVRAHLVACYRELTISVDAHGLGHDALRGWPGGYARLSQSVAALAAERLACGLRLRVNVVLLRDTIATFGALCHSLVEWGIDEITFNQVGGRDRPDTWPELRLRPEQVEALARALPSLRGELAGRGLLLRGDTAYLRRMHASARDLAIPVADCAPGEHFLFIDEGGAVSPCGFTGAELGVPVADLDTVAALRALPTAWRRAQRRGLAPCADCHSTQVFGKFGGAAASARAAVAAK